jgi:hypothetical protein
MKLARLLWWGCIFSLGLVPPDTYKPQVNTLSAPDTVWLRRFIQEKAPQLLPYLQKAAEYHLQIIYTQVNRDAKNRPILKHYALRLDTNEYFYPASLVKLPLAVLALEKVNQLRSLGVTHKSLMQLERGNRGCLRDAPSELYSIEEAVLRQLVFSDNPTFDYFYALVPPWEAVRTLSQRGYKSVFFGHRLGRSCSPAENRCVEGIRLLSPEGKELHRMAPRCVDSLPAHPYAGHPYLLDPQGNALSLKDAHQMLISLIFPIAVPRRQRFQLRTEDYALLRRYLSMYPSETGLSKAYPPHIYHDAVRKYFLLGASDTARLPERIRIFNKVGMAYGYLVDCAYIVDFQVGVEFFVSAVLKVESPVPGPSAAGYNWAKGLYFFRELGWALYRYETTRKRPRPPDLSGLKYVYTHR